MIIDGNTYYKVANGSIDSAGLPSEYQQVEYIQSSGTQYIDTGISCNNDTGIEADIQQVSYNTNNWSVWIGSLKTTSDGYWIHLGQASRDRGLRFSWGAGAGTYVYTNISSSDFNRHKYQIDKGELTIDNITTYTLTNSYEFTTSPSTIVLFADKKGSTITEYSSIKIFYCKLYDNNVLIKNLIPCYRISDNVIGMYDTVNDVFYTNKGTGTFLKGPNVYNRYTIKEFDRPYISGHVTDESSTFTFSVNNTDVTVNVDANGNFKYKPTSTITSLSFVGVPQLESLELFKIDGVSTFNVDYPTEVTFKKCDNITQNAKVDIYHISGTATEDFTFKLKYIDDNDTTFTVTESAVIDENGKWDISYSGKKIYTMQGTFYDNDKLLSLEMTEDFAKCVMLTNSSNAQFQSFRNCDNLMVISFPNATFALLTIEYNLFRNNIAMERLIMPKVQFDNIGTLSNPFYQCKALQEIIVPTNSSFPLTISFESSPLTYDSMLRVAGWLKDLSGGTAQTVTFKASTYDALTAEQQAALTAIIVTQKGWNLATA